LNFIKNTFTTFSVRIITVLFALIVSIVIARVLGPEGKGAYTLLLLIPTILVMVGNLGIGLANTYFGGSGKDKWNELASNSLVS